MELILPAAIWQEVEGSQFHGYPGASWNNDLKDVACMLEG